MTLFVHFLIGGIMPPTIWVLANIPWTANLADSMRWWFTFLPTYCVCEGIVFSSTYRLLNLARIGLSYAHFDVNQINTNVWALENLGGNAVIMGGVGVVCTLLLVLIEADIFQRCANFTFRSLPKVHHHEEEELDEDVVAENDRVNAQFHGGKGQLDGSNARLLDPESQTKDGSDVIRIANLRKAYTTVFGKPVLAVEQLSFGLDYGECFALLGVNGAGKSTTFKSLTRDIVPTAGDISIGGYSVTNEFSEARKLIGYCPQHEAIFPLMTVLEHLWFYARIKGILAGRIHDVVEEAIVQLGLVG